MPLTLTPQQSLAMAYARLLALRDDLDLDYSNPLEPMTAALNQTLDHLHFAGFDLSAFKLDIEAHVEGHGEGFRTRLDAVLDFMVLLAGLP